MSSLDSHGHILDDVTSVTLQTDDSYYTRPSALVKSSSETWTLEDNLLWVLADAAVKFRGHCIVYYWRGGWWRVIRRKRILGGLDIRSLCVLLQLKSHGMEVCVPVFKCSYWRCMFMWVCCLATVCFCCLRQLYRASLQCCTGVLLRGFFKPIFCHFLTLL